MSPAAGYTGWAAAVLAGLGIAADLVTGHETHIENMTALEACNADKAAMLSTIETLSLRVVEP